MRVVNPGLIKDKKILIRLDLDVPLRPITNNSPELEIAEDFRLKTSLPTLQICLKNASQLILIGHLGRPFKTKDDEAKGPDPALSLRPIKQWLEKALYQDIVFANNLEEIEANSKVVLLENLRFFHGEMSGKDYHASCSSQTCDIDFAHKLATFGDLFINEAFAAHHPSASTTILPTLLPSAAGLRFAQEVNTLTDIRDNPKRPFIAIIGGAKIEDKYSAITGLSKIADQILVGGLLPKAITEGKLEVSPNVLLAQLNEQGSDISVASLASFCELIKKAKLIVWGGPVGKYEDPSSNKGNQVLAQEILSSDAKSVICGGDTITSLKRMFLLEKFNFVSVGGGAALLLLSEGTLPTIKALEENLDVRG